MMGYRKWTFPLVVVGMNSIFIYFVSEVLFGWLDRAVGVFTFHYRLHRKARSRCASYDGAVRDVVHVLLAV